MKKTFKQLAQIATSEMRKVFPPTPLQKNEYLSDIYGAELWLKREDLTPVRSYKLRGAYNAMRKLHGQQHFVCASAGNHAQGVAYMSKYFHVKATIFMPTTTPQQKITKTKIFGGNYIDIILVGDYFDECLSAAKIFSVKKNAYFLSPFDDVDVIEGQSTVAVEIESQLLGVPDSIIMPVGGGGLSSGVLSYFEDQCSYKLVEPTGAASLRAALCADEPVALDSIDNFADGASVARVGELNFIKLKNVGLENVLTVPEDRICTTMLEMLDIEGIVLEPAGAMAIDALRDIADSIRGRKVVCITTGGNFDFERLPEVKERSQRHSGIKKYLILKLPQRPGALKDFLNQFGPTEDITRFEYLKKSARNFGSVLIGIETTSPEKIDILFQRLDKAGFSYSDITNDESLSQFLV